MSSLGLDQIQHWLIFGKTMFGPAVTVVTVAGFSGDGGGLAVTPRQQKQATLYNRSLN